MSAVQLRDYQIEALDCIESDFKNPETSRVLLALPTGTGKTVLFSHAIARRVGDGQRALVLTHTDELVNQTARTLRSVLPETVTTGIVKAERNEVDAQVIVASVQSLITESRRAQLPAMSLIVADEAHHAVAPSWMATLTDLGVFKPGGPKLLGATATPFRFDEVGLDNLFNKISFRRTLLEMIEAGWLCDLRAMQIELDADFNKLKVSAGDYKVNESADMLMEANAPAHVAAAYKEHAMGRKAIVFTPTVLVAEAMTQAFLAEGIASETVHGGLDRDTRRAIIARLASGETMVVCNCMVLTEGFDEPSVECIVIARPTRSTPLYTQMVGRGTRLFPGKLDCLILDCVGATKRHDLVTAATLEGLGLQSAKESVREKQIRERIELEERNQAERARLIAREVDLFKQRTKQWVASPPEKDHDRCTPAFVMELGNQRRLAIYKKLNGEGYVLTIRYDRGPLTRVADGTIEDLTARATQIQRIDGAQVLADPTAPWRSKPATEKQKAAAKKFNVKVSPGMTAGEVADKLSIAIERAERYRDINESRKVLDGRGRP